MYLAARGPGKPHILQINDLFIIDAELKLASSIAAQQKSIFSFRTRLKCACAIFVQLDRLCRRIEFRQRRIVPQQAVPVCRNEKGYRDVCIRLQQPDRNVAQIEESLLMLSQSVQRFVGERRKSWRISSVCIPSISTGVIVRPSCPCSLNTGCPAAVRNRTESRCPVNLHLEYAGLDRHGRSIGGNRERGSPARTNYCGHD